MPKPPKSVLPLPRIYSRELIALFAEHGHDAARSFLRLVYKREVPAWDALPEAHRSVFVSAASLALDCVDEGVNEDVAAAAAATNIVSADLGPQTRQWPAQQLANFAAVFARAGLAAASVVHEDLALIIVLAASNEQEEQGEKVRTLREQKKLTAKKKA